MKFEKKCCEAIPKLRLCFICLDFLTLTERYIKLTLRSIWLAKVLQVCLAYSLAYHMQIQWSRMSVLTGRQNLRICWRKTLKIWLHVYVVSWSDCDMLLCLFLPLHDNRFCVSLYSEDNRNQIILQISSGCTLQSSKQPYPLRKEVHFCSSREE